jgi:hypothetical protein
MPTAIREALSANMSKMDGSSAPEPGPSASSPEAAAVGAIPADTHHVEQIAAIPEGNDAPAKEGRDERGRFATKAPPAEPKADAKPVPAKDAAPTEPAAPTAVKPPASMRASVREQWAKVPAEVQAEMVRIENAHQQKMREASEHQRKAAAFDATIQPYRDVLGPEPLKDVEALLQTGKALRTGDKEAVVAQIISGFGVDVGRLAAILEGKEQPRRAAPQQEFRDPRVDDLMRRLEEQGAQQKSAIQAKVDAEVGAFREKAEFFEDVKDEMGLVLQRAQQRGETPTIQQVYERACLLNEDVRPLYQQRKAAEAASARAPTPARRPTTSLRNEPTAPAPAPKPKTIRDHILAAEEKLSGR